MIALSGSLKGQSQKAEQEKFVMFIKETAKKAENRRMPGSLKRQPPKPEMRYLSGSLKGQSQEAEEDGFAWLGQAVSKS